MSDARLSGLVAIAGILSAVVTLLTIWLQRARRRKPSGADHWADVGHRGRHPYDKL